MPVDADATDDDNTTSVSHKSSTSTPDMPGVDDANADNAMSANHDSEHDVHFDSNTDVTTNTADTNSVEHDTDNGSLFSAPEQIQSQQSQIETNINSNSTQYENNTTSSNGSVHTTDSDGSSSSPVPADHPNRLSQTIDDTFEDSDQVISSQRESHALCTFVA